MLKSHARFHSRDDKRQILVADDEFINRELLRAVLQESYDLVFAENGKEALELCRTNADTLSLVLLDLMMPVMGGMEMLREAKADSSISGIPVIVISADQESEVESLTLGAADFIPKPYPPASVIHARVLRTIELYEDRQIISSTERDALTGLYNREYFYRYAEQYDQHHKDVGMDAIVVDVNHFHMINERFGTNFGDEVLRRISNSLRNMVNPHGGIACRREADTFMLYCPHGIDCERMLEDVSNDLTDTDGDTSTLIWLRMGVYYNVDKSIDVVRRFDRAKTAADLVQGSFAQRIGVYDDKLHDRELYSEQLIENFDAAIREHQFQVYFQPKFDVRLPVPALASSEALVRWIHPRLGMISPGVFIPLFEENGLIQQLDHYVWRQAATMMRDWHDRLGFATPISVNVSRVDMYDPRLIDTLQEIVTSNGLSTHEMLLEITESAYTQDSEQIIDTVNKLRALGFRIEMDDFGTGYSSLNMISKLPIDVLKLDMQFIRHAFSGQQDTRMLEVILDIADYLSVPVIAEGVETEQQMLTLRDMGCDYVQGYYFSPPVPAKEFERFLVERRDLGDQGLIPTEDALDSLSEAEEALSYITQALSGDMESIFYVDVSTDSYQEFRTGASHGKLRLRSSGHDFFGVRKASFLATVHPNDRQKMDDALNKDRLLVSLVSNPLFLITYRVMVDGSPYHYRMRVGIDQIGGSHLIIGTSNVDGQISEVEERFESQQRSALTYAGIVQALAYDYFCIFYVDLKTDEFVEYSSQEAYKKLGMPQSGDDFFEMSRTNTARIIHPDDVDIFLGTFTRENVLDSLRRNHTFTLTYRLFIDGEITYIHMKATRMEDNADEHMVIGISDVSEQMVRERDYAYALRLANQDALTGVKSKLAYTNEEKKINQGIQDGTQEPFGIVVCDINDLKHVNDTMGHAAGDQYIRDACMIVCNIFNHCPVYRIGGDEFVAILRGGAYEERHELMKRLEASNHLANHNKQNIRIAGGLSVWDAANDTLMADVFYRADKAMYADKKRLKELDDTDETSGGEIPQ